MLLSRNSLIRRAVQSLWFLLLTYGGRLGLNLGPSLPCLSCAYVPGCGGVCYLRLFQSPVGGIGMSLASLFSERGLQGLLAFLLFGFLAVIFGHSWCGWVCPFGLIQDALAGLRKKLKIREALFTAKTRKLLRVFKYSLLFYLIVTPILVTLGLAHPDLSLPFCSICPAKIIMPALAGNFNWLALDFTNLVLFINSLILIVFTGVTLVGAFFKDRFFCLVCPLPLLIHIFKPIFLLKLTKEPRACLGCATCQRLCPVDLDASTKERRRGDFQASGCQGCFVCVQNCGSDGSLAVKVGPKTIYKSSRRP